MCTTKYSQTLKVLLRSHPFHAESRIPARIVKLKIFYTHWRWAPKNKPGNSIPKDKENRVERYRHAGFNIRQECMTKLPKDFDHLSLARFSMAMGLVSTSFAVVSCPMLAALLSEIPLCRWKSSPPSVGWHRGLTRNSTSDIDHWVLLVKNRPSLPSYVMKARDLHSDLIASPGHGPKFCSWTTTTDQYIREFHATA